MQIHLKHRVFFFCMLGLKQIITHTTYQLNHCCYQGAPRTVSHNTDASGIHSIFCKNLILEKELSHENTVFKGSWEWILRSKSVTLEVNQAETQQSPC